MSKLLQKSLFQGLLLSASIGIASLYCAPSYANAIESGEGVFAVLASEIALQRGEAGLAYKTYLDLAQDLKDPRLAQRAMEIAIAAGSSKLALQAAQEWESLAKPSDVKPKEVLITLYILNQRWTDAVPPAIALLNHQAPAQREKTLFQLQELIAKTGNEAQGMSAYYEIVSALKPEP